MRRNFRRIEKREGVEFVRCEVAEDVPEFLDALFDLHQKRWQVLGLDGCFKRRPAEAIFYRKFAKLAFEKNWLAMFAIRENGIHKAVQIGYVFDGVYLQLQEGYDPQFQNGVGNALRYYAIREFIAEGIREYDFLAGESEHKRRWSAQVRIGYDVLIGSGSLKSRLLFLGSVWPSGRFVEQQGIEHGW
jgi:CelD/BcsL family acetyltransferase involved in cellulose biosynthesis